METAFILSLFNNTCQIFFSQLLTEDDSENIVSGSLAIMYILGCLSSYFIIDFILHCEYVAMSHAKNRFKNL